MLKGVQLVHPLMKRFAFFGLILIFVTGCDQLASIPYEPEQTPESWLIIQPYMTIDILSQNVILMQPSSTFLVYLLGIITILVGFYTFKIQEGQHSRGWWGIAMLLWGVGALFAGTSYQAFSYEIKCVGRELCSWTSWWEIIYLMLSAGSIAAMLISGAYCCCLGKWRRTLVVYACISIILYTVLILFGAFTLNKFLISFEFLLVFAVPNIIILFLLNGWRYYKFKMKKDLMLLGTWLWLGAVMATYFIYLLMGLTEQLWERQIWFSENDVLHIGLISWMLYIAFFVVQQITDNDGEESI